MSYNGDFSFVLENPHGLGMNLKYLVLCSMASLAS